MCLIYCILFAAMFFGVLPLPIGLVLTAVIAVYEQLNKKP